MRIYSAQAEPHSMVALMNKAGKFLSLSLLVIAAAHLAQAQVTDLRTLVGRKAILQRISFYKPGTYTVISDAYAGQEVTIVAFKPSAMLASIAMLSAGQMASLPPQSRALFENARNAGTLVVQFSDGTRADTGASPVMPSMLGSYLELIPNKATPNVSVEPKQIANLVPNISVKPKRIAHSAPTTSVEPKQIAHSAPGDLSDAQVTAAIQKAMHGKQHSIGLTLNDVQTALFSGMVCDTCETSGYTIQIFTPEQWIEQAALKARGEMLPFSLADVTPDMRRPYLRVLALPSRADYINGAGLSMASSVHRVVLSNTARTETIQPLDNENGTLTDNSAFRSVDYTSASALFPMSEVKQIRSEDKHGQFFVVVVGDNQNKFFKVKTRFLKRLFGASSH